MRLSKTGLHCNIELKFVFALCKVEEKTAQVGRLRVHNLDYRKFNQESILFF